MCYSKKKRPKTDFKKTCLTTKKVNDCLYFVILFIVVIKGNTFMKSFPGENLWRIFKDLQRSSKILQDLQRSAKVF